MPKVPESDFHVFPQDEPPILLTLEEAATYLRVHRTTLYRLIYTKQLKGVIRVGGQYRIDRLKLIEWIRSNTH